MAFANIHVDGEKIAEVIESAAKRVLMEEGQEVNKPWGKEKILDYNDSYVVKEITVNKGEELSLQYHEKKRETIFHLKGYGRIFKAGEYYSLTDKEKVHIEPYEIHSIQAHPQYQLKVLEVSTPELEDVVRIKDKYGRV